MRRSLFSIVTASAVIAGAGVAAAQTTTTTTTWTNDQGGAITAYSTSKHYSSFTDPALTTTIGTPLPATVTMYPLPDTINVPAASTYSYSIVNNHPVVMETTTRKVVHTWN